MLIKLSCYPSLFPFFRALDTQVAETAEGTRRSEEQVLLCNNKLEKVLLEHGAQVMRLAGLETAHTHYLADRAKGERERQVSDICSRVASYLLKS